ncbi:MAG: hypothetical protein HRU08_08285, partial [Oleispira sp.]|nr:hypothetical protein [Oleispira sp.]
PVGTLVNDALYGIGIAIDPWLYKEAAGYARFKKDLVLFINKDNSNVQLELIAEINDYLNTNELTNIASGSILHQKCKDILKAQEQAA